MKLGASCMLGNQPTELWPFSGIDVIWGRYVGSGSVLVGIGFRVLVWFGMSIGARVLVLGSYWLGVAFGSWC